MDLEEQTLYVGFDDSNHAWNPSTEQSSGRKFYGEVVVAVFSYLKEDGLVVAHPNRKKYKSVQEALDVQERDFLFTILTHEGSRHTNSNLALAAPVLVREYLGSIRDAGKYPNQLKFYFDGRLGSSQKDFLRRNFPGFPEMVIDNFIKKRKTGKGKSSKKHFCPSVVYMADVLASGILRNLNLEEAFSDSHFIPLPIAGVSC